MLIKNGTLVTLGEKNEIIPEGAVLVREDYIADLGSSVELAARYPDEDVLNARGKLVMPGLICAHTHFYGAFARGMAIPGEPPANFPQILERLWWRLDKALDYEDIRYSALVCLIDAIRHGTTCLIDHHASPNAIDGSLDVIAEAVEEAGVRACLCYEVTDRDGAERAKAGIRENVRFIKKVQGYKGAKVQRGYLESYILNLITCTFGLHASLTLSDETLEECVTAARDLGVGFHIHVAEDIADVEDSIRRSGMRVVERLAKLGILGPKTIAAHCVHLNEREMEILKGTDTKVVHNPRSNMNNAVGTADVPAMLGRGVLVGLGNDGFSNNMFVEMHAAYLVHKLAKRDPRVMGADQVLRMAFQNNAQIASLFWPERPLGEISIGAHADIVLVDYNPITPLTDSNFPWHIIFGVDGTGIDTVIVGGRLLMKGGKLLTLDEEEICARAKELARKVWRRISRISATN